MGIQENMSKSIRSLKEVQHKSLVELSEELEISRSTLQKYLDGHGNPSLKMVEHLAEKLFGQMFGSVVSYSMFCMKMGKYIAMEPLDQGGPEYVEIPESVEQVGFYAFWKCRNLKEIRLPDEEPVSAPEAAPEEDLPAIAEDEDLPAVTEKEETDAE